MATFTVTSSINIDQFARNPATADIFNINGGYLTIDEDYQFGGRSTISSSIGNIVLSATEGGTVEFNATKVRLVPFTGGSGVVPPYNTVISQGSAQGRNIGVYARVNAYPCNPGDTMPSTGFIKIKQWNDVSFASGTLTGVTASCDGVDRVGWIRIPGIDASTVTVNRLNTFKVRGDWFQVGTTNGIISTTYALPFRLDAYLGGVWVETSSGSNSYEFYPSFGTGASTVTGSDAIRGKYCKIEAATSLLRFGQDEFAAAGGYLPPAGCRIRIPNVLLATSLTTGFDILPNATLATRYDFTTTGGGVIDIENANINWYLSLAQARSVRIVNTALMSQLSLSEIASPIELDNVGVGQEAATAQLGLTISTCKAGGTMNNCVWTSATLAASGRYVCSWSDCDGFTVTNERTCAFQARGNATTGAYTMTRVTNSSWTNTVVGGGRILMTTCTDVNFSGTLYYDHPSTTTATANPMYVWDIASSCARLKFDGLTFGGLTLCQPYNGILNVGAAGCDNIKLRNIGTFSSPLDLGGQQQNLCTWTRTTTTLTVTKVAHGLKTNDIVYVIYSSALASFAVGSKTVTGTPTADTFTFACTNAGPAAGTLSYYPTMSANLFVVAASAAASNIEVKRCYTPHTRTNLYTIDNSTKGVVIENVMGDYLNAPTTPMLNGELKGVHASPTLAAQTACYGTHWFDVFTGNVPTQTGSVAWNRVGATVFVTASHMLRTGELVNVLTSSNTASLPLGSKTVTAFSSSHFTIPATATGPIAGTMSYIPMTGRIGLLMNEATAETTNVYTIVTGSAFTSAGGLFMPVSGSEITFVTPEYVLGHSYFPPVEAVMAGGTLTNYNVFYSIDKNDGNGFSDFRNLSYVRPLGQGVSGSQNITMFNIAGVQPGDYVFGTNIAPNAFVNAVTSSNNSASLSIANNGTVSGLLRFNHLPAERGISPTLGFKLKIKLITSASNATAITSLYCLTTNDVSSSRSAQYPLDLVPLTLTGLQNPSEVRVFNYNTTTEITGSESVTGGTFTADIDVTQYPTVDIAVLSLGYQNTRLLSQSLGEGLTIPVSQVVDRQYGNT